MKKRGMITGILFVVLLAFVFQTEIGGFFADVRDKAFASAKADKEQVSADLPDYAETETIPKAEASAPPTAETAEASTDISYKEVSLYFVDTQKDDLAVETRSIINQAGVAKTTLNELLTGPVSSTLASYIPEGTTVKSIDIDDTGLCTVDFSEQLQNSNITSSQEKYVIESIVNTLSQFDSVKAVQIRINGNIVNSIAGHWDISKPLTAE